MTPSGISCIDPPSAIGAALAATCACRPPVDASMTTARSDGSPWPAIETVALTSACRTSGTPTGWVDVAGTAPLIARSEEHTSELQSLMRISYAVFCLKKKNQRKQNKNTQHKHIKLIERRATEITERN